MGWERRHSRGVYYYKAFRINGTVRRIYLGKGAFGRVHELLDREEARKRAAWKARKKEWGKQAEEADGRWREAWKLLMRLIRASHLVGGQYCCANFWRPVQRTPMTRHLYPVPPWGPNDEAQLDHLNARANGGDAVAIEELRAILVDHPVWERLTGLIGASTEHRVREMAGEDEAKRTKLLGSLERWKAEWRGAAPSRLEAVMVDQAAALRLEMAWAESQTGLAGLPTPLKYWLMTRGLTCQKRVALVQRKLGDVRRRASSSSTVRNG